MNKTIQYENTIASEQNNKEIVYLKVFICLKYFHNRAYEEIMLIVLLLVLYLNWELGKIKVYIIRAGCAKMEKGICIVL